MRAPSSSRPVHLEPGEVAALLAAARAYRQTPGAEIGDALATAEAKLHATGAVDRAAAARARSAARREAWLQRVGRGPEEETPPDGGR